MRILLDMDGVCADMVTPMLRHLGIPNTFENLCRAIDITDDMGITQEEFWRRMDTAGAEFWANLEPYPWFWPMWDRLNQMADVVICTSAGRSEFALAGKMTWMKKYLGRTFRDFMFIMDKHLVARPSHLLIDDTPKLVKRFREHEGEAVLFPQPWNGSTETLEDVYTRVALIVARTEGVARSHAGEN